MNWIIDVLVGISLVAFFAGILVHTFAKNSKNAGIDARKWTNILLIIGSIGLFILIGYIGLWDYYQKSQVADLVYGLMGLYFGTLMVWMNINNLRQIDRSSKMKAFWGVISGAILSIAYGLLFFLQYQEDGSFSFRDALFIGLGIYVIIISIRKTRQIKTASIEQ